MMKKKRIISILLALCMVLTTLPLTGLTAFAATGGELEKSAAILGDVNENGLVDVADARWILQAAAGMRDFFTQQGACSTA